MSTSVVPEITATLAATGAKYVAIDPVTNTSSVPPIGAVRVGDNQTVTMRPVNG